MKKRFEFVFIVFAIYDINSIGTTSNANKNVVFIGRNKENT